MNDVDPRAFIWISSGNTKPQKHPHINRHAHIHSLLEGFINTKSAGGYRALFSALKPPNFNLIYWSFKEITEAWTLFFFSEIGQHSPALMVFFRVIDWYIILWLWEPRFSDSQLFYHCEAEKRERERNKERWEVL